MNVFFSWLAALINSLAAKPKPVPAPIPIPTPEPVPSPVLVPLETFCTAIRDFEGQPGDQNYRFNNPGNFRCSPVGYLEKYGNVRCSPNGFAIFQHYDLGWAYLVASVQERIKKHPDWTFIDWVKNYAPASDGNPVEAYYTFLAKRCGQLPSAKLSEVLALSV